MKLNEIQQAQLDNLLEVFEKYEETERELNSQYQYAQEGIKYPVRAAIESAREVGVPDRQIHLIGLKMPQKNQMARFEAVTTEQPLEEVAPEVLTAVHETFTVADETPFQFNKITGKGTALVDGKTYEMSIFGDDAVGRWVTGGLDWPEALYELIENYPESKITVLREDED